MELKKLLEERTCVAKEMNDLTAEVKRDGRAFNGEELEKFDKMDADFKALSERIETAKRIERMSEVVPSKSDEKFVNNHRALVSVTRQDQELAFKAWALKAGGKESFVTRKHMEAAHKVGINLNSDSLTVTLSDEIQRNQSSGVNAEGGYLQNDGVFQSLERNLKFFGGARNVARVIRTDTGEPISYAYSDSTALVGVRLGQNMTVANQNITYSKKTLGEFTYSSGVYPVAVQLLQDARIDVSSDIGEVLGIELARVQNTDFTTGNGAAMPSGFLNDASAGVTAGSASVLAYADLVKLLFSVDRAYRDDPSFAFSMADSTLSALWQIVDGNSRPLFWNQLQNLASGNPLQILNKPIQINNDMPAIATGKVPVVAMVGSKFIIRDVKDATVVALRERFMDQLAVGFIAYLRSDCKLLNSNCCKKLTMA